MTKPSLLQRLRRSRFLVTLIKIALTLGALYLVFRGVDTSHLSEMLQRQDHSLLLAAFGLFTLQLLLGAFRWRLILATLAGKAAPVIRALECIRIYYISVFFNICLPGTVGGDVIRVWLAKSDHVPMSLSAHSVIIDRIIALAALGIMIVATMPYLGELAGFPAVPAMLALVALGLLGIWLLRVIDRLLAPLEHIRPVRWLLYFLGSLRLLLRHPGASLRSLAQALVAHVSYCLGAWVLAYSLQIDVTPMQIFTLLPPVTLAATLPVSIGGWGIREAGMVGMLGLAGVPQAAALMLSIQLGLGTILISLPGGPLWLATRKTARASGHGAPMDAVV